jgi:hypothetical protein
MPIFQTPHQSFFEQARWENASLRKSAADSASAALESSENTSDNQFILLQLAEGDKRVLNTTEVTPKLQGADKPDINLLLDFDAFKIGSNEGIDPETKATLQLKVGQENKLDKLDKLFYCVNGGLDLFNEVTKKKSEAKDFRKNTDAAFGNKPISLPSGTGQISLQVVKHRKPKWWQRVFGFAKSNTGQELMSLIGFPGVTEIAINSISGMLDNLFGDDEPDILFQSLPIKLAFSQLAKEELGGGISTTLVSCLNPGFWIMARRSDFNTFISNKPIYYNGLGLLAPEGMPENEAGSNDNPFSKLTYAIIRAKMKEVDLNQGLF